ncbi:MAG: endonuclease/exonuclease/phosphatase family protein [Mycobacterium sp.]
MRLLPRRRPVAVETYDAATGGWTVSGTAKAVDCEEFTITTYNIWNDTTHAEARYLAIAQLLSRRQPDVMVFQEVTPVALEIFTAQDWIRDGYARAAVVGSDTGDYGMLILSRLPVSQVIYTRLPTRLSRGFLRAELALTGKPTVVCCVHLDSGKSSSWLRGWQLRRIFNSLKSVDDAVVLGDFNMRDTENWRIASPYCDVWRYLRPGEDGFTEDTSVNHMRYDMKDKHRHVRFDRVLLKSRHWTAAHIELLGTEPIAPGLPRVFPSDHFGLLCRLTSRNP